MNIDLKNMNMTDLKEQILKNLDKKTLIKIGIGVGSIIIFLIIYYVILNPIVKEKKAKLEDMQLKETEIVQIINDISSMKKRIKKLKPDVDKYSRLFHTKAEVEGLYQTLSDFADQNDLVISRIEKKQIKEVLKSVALAKADGKKVNAKKTQTKNVKNNAYYLIPVDFEIDGNFIGYIKFKRALSLSNKMLNFDKESIQVVKGDTTGAIKVKGSLTIVGLPNEFF